MADTPPVQSKVLFVDDDLSFLQMLRDVFSEASGGAWEIQTATSGGDALQRLRSKPVDLIVIDVFMPGMDGLQLLRILNDEFPSLPKVLLTGMPDGNTRAAALEGGAALFLEKPASAVGYQSVFATLNELLRWHQRFSSRGSLKRLGLLDLVKLECKSGNSRMFEVFVGNVRGEIYVQEGVIIHALMPDRRGQSAFTYLTTTPGAVFYLRQFEEPIERSVDRQWEFLVMEAAHVIAQLSELPPESELDEEQPETPSEPALSPAPPEPAAAPSSLKLAPPRVPEVKEAPRAEPMPAAASLPSIIAKPSVLKPRAPSPTTLETKGSGDLKLSEAPDELPLEYLADPAGFKVEELVLCADFREVLHAVNCIDSNKRMRLAEALAQKTQGFGTLLPLGELERIELNSTGNRMVMRYDGRRCLLVRTNTKLVQPSGNPSATDSAEEWLARYPELRGVLALTVSGASGRLYHRGFAKDFPNDVAQVIAQEAARLSELALKQSFPAWFIRAVYSRCQLYAFRRLDGAVLVAWLNRNGIDRAAVDKFYAEFSNVRPA